MYHLDIFISDVRDPLRLSFNDKASAERMVEFIGRVANDAEDPRPFCDDDGTQVSFRLVDLRALRVWCGD